MNSPNQTEEQQQQQKKADKEENTTASETKKQQEKEENSSQGGDGGGSGGGWGGGWDFSSFSVLSDLQKAAEEISKNAVAVAKSAAKSITDNGDDSESESLSKEKEEEEKERNNDEPGDSKNEVLRDSALNRLENASEDTILGQGLKALDDSVESFASGAWLALGSAWKGGSALVHKLENSAATFADSIQNSSLPLSPRSLAPSILESGKSFTAKGIEVLERVGKETLDLLITETGLDIDKKSEHLTDEEQFEEVNFEHCFYIYGGPDQLEELEALSNHYALLFNRKKTKLSSEQQSDFDAKFRDIQKLLNMSSEIEEEHKGKHIEMSDEACGSEMKKLHDSSVAKAADLAAGFTAALEGLAMNDIIQRTTDRLDTSHTECVHRLSELCSFAVTNILMLGKSIISNINRKGEETVTDMKVDWPDDSEAKAKIIRTKAIVMSRDVESVARSFVTGISDITEAYEAASKKISSSKEEDTRRFMREKASMIWNHINTDQASALGKIQDALQYLAYVVISTSMPSA